MIGYGRDSMQGAIRLLFEPRKLPPGNECSFLTVENDRMRRLVLQTNYTLKMLNQLVIGGSARELDHNRVENASRHESVPQ